MKIIETRIKESIDVKSAILNDIKLLGRIENASNRMTEAYKNNRCVYFCGNGGSASDAQHLAAELSGRFNYDRPPLMSEALHVNSSFVTAVANDYGYEHVYSRMIQAAGKEGDILVGLSTSGNSPNIVKAFEQAKSSGLITVAMTGSTGGKLKELADILINVPSDTTARIQEAHILIGHVFCELIESNIFPKL
jgi:D-sedoheptulose 7-phosphate isomerase